MFLIGRFGYHVALPHHVGALAVALIVGTICFTSIGVATSTLIPNQEAAGPVVSIIFFILLFLSGLWYPIKNGSGSGPGLELFPGASHDQLHRHRVPGPGLELTMVVERHPRHGDLGGRGNRRFPPSLELGATPQ